MFCSRCVLPVLALYLLLEEMSALPNRLRQKRDVNWLDQEFFPHLPDRSERGDLSPGDAGDANPDLEGRHSQSATFLTLLEHLPVQRHNNNNHNSNYRRKHNDKRMRVAPLDTIGSSLKSSYHIRKEEPEDDWEEM